MIGTDGPIVKSDAALCDANASKDDVWRFFDAEGSPRR